MRKQATRKIALAAVLAALSVVFLFFGSVITVLDLSCAALGSIVIIFAVLELGGIYPWLIWIVSSTLALLLCPDKFGAVVFLVFAGYYPILKRYFERTKPIVQWVLKLLCFNLAFTAILLITFFVMDFGISANSSFFIITAYLGCNLVFVVYDIALTMLISKYIFNFRDKFKFLRK